MEYPQVSIIIVNWNNWEDSIGCLDSLYNIVYPNYNLIFVDNDSKDNSIEKIEKYCKKSLGWKFEFVKYSDKDKYNKFVKYDRSIDFHKNRHILIKNDANYGFAEGNNIGIRYALSLANFDYILLLNNDTVVDKYFLDNLIQVAESEDSIGVVGPRINYYDYPDWTYFLGGYINFYKGQCKWISNFEIGGKEIDYIEGSCFLIKKEVILKVGLMDAIYFAYWDETDWCIRIKRAGYSLVCAQESRIWHKVSATSKKVNGFSEYYFTRNNFLFMRRYASSLQYLSFLLWFFSFTFWARSIQILIYSKNIKNLNCFYKGIVNGILLSPK